MIKSKVKQNNIEEAISNYNAIYTQNISTPKGIHAFINKEILSAGAGDNITDGSVFENIEISQNAINSILKNVIRNDKNILSGLIMKPKGYSLSQNYPNPFNPSTKINFALPKEGLVTLKVYDILGKEIATIVNGNRIAGYYDVEFDASNFSSGMYFYKLESENFVETKRMLLIK